MTRIILTSSGSYPRIGEGEPGQRLRKAYTEFEQGKRTGAELQKIERELTSEVISLQAKAGLELVTDGQIGWYDPISHFLGKTEGVEIDGLFRFFDTNFYYRQPIIMGKVKWKAPIVLDEFLFAKSVSPLPVKPVITGAYTLGRLSVDRYYNDFPKLLNDITEVIAREVELLADKGAEIIQIDEPAIVRNPTDILLLGRELDLIIKYKGGAQIALYTYFGDTANIYQELQSLPIDILGLDFTYSQRLPEVIASLENKKVLGLGLIDGRNTKMESEEDIFPILSQIMPAIGAGNCYLNPSCGLEYLPWDRAFHKLENMKRLCDKFVEGQK